MNETKPHDEMNIQWDDQEMISLEIDCDSLDSVGIFDYFAPAIAALEPIAATLEVATVYSIEIPSLNFGTPCNSIFMCVVGDEYILKKIFTAYKNIGNVRCRYSDMLSPDEMNCILQVVDGYVWQPYEPGTWCIASTDHVLSVADSDVSTAASHTYVNDLKEQKNTRKDTEDLDDLGDLDELFGIPSDGRAVDLDSNNKDVARLLKLRTYFPETLSIDPEGIGDTHTAAFRYEQEYANAGDAMLMLDELKDYANHLSDVLGDHFIHASDGFDELSWMVDEIKEGLQPLSEIEDNKINHQQLVRKFLVRYADENIELQIKISEIAKILEFEIATAEYEYSREVIDVIRLCFSRLEQLVQRMQDF